MNLLFERFLSAERAEPPDIDVDFEHSRRDEVFQYVYEKYGRARAARLAAIVTRMPQLHDDAYVPSAAELVAVVGISDTLAAAFMRGLAQFREFKEHLGIGLVFNKAGAGMDARVGVKGGPMSGQTVVFTGFRDASLKADIEARGGTVDDAVTARTTTLVAKDLLKATAKVLKAQKAGVAVHSLDDFRALLYATI
jgi:NAD-dependent DNA ligase